MTLNLIRGAGRAVGGAAAGAAASGGTRLMRRVLPDPLTEPLPPGRMVDLAGRGRAWVVDIPGPTADAPTVVLLHALGCTAYLTWFGVIADLSQHYRVVALDQRWHGRGIVSERFTLEDCADDVVALLDVLALDQAVLVGYSMGGMVAQLVWHRHPGRVAGLVLASTTRNLRGDEVEKVFFVALSLLFGPLTGLALGGVRRLGGALPELPTADSTKLVPWGWEQLRSTSAWSLPEVLSAIGRFNSAPWIHDVDVPTSVVVTHGDHAIPARRQIRLAESIESAETYVAPGGHASVFLDRTSWNPLFLEAVASVVNRVAARKRLAG